MNLSTLSTFAQLLSNDVNGTRYATQYATVLNEAQYQFAMDSKCTFKDMAIQTIVSGTASYPLPTDFMWEKLILVNGLMLPPISRFELARTNTGTRWDQRTGTPTAYNIDPDLARQSILLFPIPQANDALAGQNDLQMTYFALPAAMVNPTDQPLNANPLLVPYHMGIAAWAASYLLMTEDPTPILDGKIKRLTQIYNDYVSQASDQFKNTVSQPIRMRGVRNYVSDLSSF